ncbi:MAG: 23S rRNA (adenine(2503)-C(2))-methyltransferase RlmN [Planctomycetota bacterium]|nr:23S rRNA (adenine(2503)-C(2))-methyltransferase RlmN [Planctomycetota bacterium]
MTEVPPTPDQAPGVAGVHLDVESVLIPMRGRSGDVNYTLCVSSQVGCAMGCTFCETGQMGLIRSLTPAEIVAQWFAARHLLSHRVTNIVFMGMGEPLDNYENVVQAIAVLKDHNGPNLSVSKICVSTVGRVDGLRKLAQQMREPGWHRLGVALSLNHADDAGRSAIMPINRKYALAELQQALIDIPVFGGGKLCIEYVLIPGVNDQREHAEKIAAFVAPINEAYRSRPLRIEERAPVSRPGSPQAKDTQSAETLQSPGTDQISQTARTPRTMLNLIPYNPRRNSPWPAPSEESVDAFMGWLRDLGVYAKRRQTKGRTLMGACGQLGSERIRKRTLVDLSVQGEAALGPVAT